MGLFQTTQYLADKKFGGAKYAGLRLLDRHKDELCIRTIPNYYSPGFQVWRYMNEGSVGHWLKEAKRQGTIILGEYRQALKDAYLEPFMASRVNCAFDFFDTKVFSVREIKATDDIGKHLSKRKDLIDTVEQFMRMHQTTIDDLFFFRSSAGIEDVYSNTFGLFDSRGHLGEAALERPHVYIADFYEQNVLKMIVNQARAQLNFVLCKFIYSGATGTVLSSFFGEGNHYMEIGPQNFTLGSNMGKRPGDLQYVNLITGNAEEFSIDMLVDAEKSDEGPKYDVKNTPSYASEEQIKAALKATTLLEEMCGCPICVEFLYEDDSSVPTFLQVRRYAPNFQNKILSDSAVRKADFLAPVAINPGEFRGPCYHLNPPFGLDDIKNKDIVDYLRKINRRNKQGYALTIPSTLNIMPFIVHIGRYCVKTSAFEVVRDICTYAKVFINCDSKQLRAQHEYMNLIQHGTKQMFISIPDFSVPDGTLIHAKSDGYRGIVNLVR